jgi:hypothetical protein
MNAKERRTARAVARSLVGRTIAAVDLNEHDDGRGGTATDPRITLDDGSFLTFSVQETEGDYGIEVTRHVRGARRRGGTRTGVLRRDAGDASSKLAEEVGFGVTFYDPEDKPYVLVAWTKEKEWKLRSPDDRSGQPDIRNVSDADFKAKYSRTPRRSTR